LVDVLFKNILFHHNHEVDQAMGIKQLAFVLV